MGAGKTSAGRALARLLRLPFKDTDLEVRRDSGLDAGEFILRRGLSAFRRAELDALRRLAAGPSAVVALGGGIYPSGRRRSLLRQAGVTVWMRRPLAEMLRLAREGGGRPLLIRRTAEAAGRLFARRERFYSMCDLQISVAGLPPARAAAKIRRSLEKSGFVPS